LEGRTQQQKGATGGKRRGKLSLTGREGPTALPKSLKQSESGWFEGKIEKRSQKKEENKGKEG